MAEHSKSHDAFNAFLFFFIIEMDRCGIAYPFSIFLLMSVDVKILRSNQSKAKIIGEQISN